MKMLIRFRLFLLTAAVVPLLLFSASAFNADSPASPDSRLGLGKWYMPLCMLFIFPQTHPDCGVDATVAFSNGMSMKSSGTMSMKIVGNSTEKEAYVWQTLEPVSFKSEGDDPKFGHIVWSLDQPQGPAVVPVEVTKIRGNNPGELFPATCDIYFYVQATIEAYPGQVFRSSTPVHMRATALGTFNPHVDEVYSVVDPVDFEDEFGRVAFTVTELTSTLN